MKYKNALFGLLALAAVGPAHAQTYTDEDIAYYVIPVSGWNMNADRYFTPTFDWTQLPSGFDYTRVLSTSFIVMQDPVTGTQPQKLTPLAKLNMGSSFDPVTDGIGGNYELQCPPYGDFCYVNLDRGRDGSSYFQNSGYQRTDVVRGYLKIGYRK